MAAPVCLLNNSWENVPFIVSSIYEKKKSVPHINVSLAPVSVITHDLNLGIFSWKVHFGHMCSGFFFTAHLNSVREQNHKSTPRFHLFLHLQFVSHPNFPQVASLLPSRVSSWLMSSLGPELCQGAWYCSGPNQEDIRGARWSLGTERGLLDAGQKSLWTFHMDIYSWETVLCAEDDGFVNKQSALVTSFSPKTSFSEESKYVAVSSGPHKQRETDL